TGRRGVHPPGDLERQQGPQGQRPGTRRRLAPAVRAVDVRDRPLRADRGALRGPVLTRRAPARDRQGRVGVHAGTVAVKGGPLDPGSGGGELRCSFGAAILDGADVDPAAAALAVAEDRLADQRNRAPSVAERYGELILAILGAQQPETSEHAFDVAALAAGVAARLGGD